MPSKASEERWMTPNLAKLAANASSYAPLASALDSMSYTSTISRNTGQLLVSLTANLSKKRSVKRMPWNMTIPLRRLNGVCGSSTIISRFSKAVPSQNRA